MDVLPVWYLYGAAALLGAILGSFLNALSFRYHAGVSMNGRSRCMRCGHTLSALDLVPVFSWLLLRGRCRYCGARISAQYPLVELAAAGVSLLFAWPLPALPVYLFELVCGMTLLFVLVYDLRHTVLPMAALVLLMVLSVVASVSSCTIVCAPLSAISGPLLAAPLLLISLFSRGRAMGWGDGLLELSLGWFLGLGVGLMGLLLAFWSGALVGLALVAVRGAKKGFTMKTELPFAPFLVLGAAAAYFLHVDFFSAIGFW